jgi:hypothetical protein
MHTIQLTGVHSTPRSNPIILRDDVIIPASLRRRCSATYDRVYTLSRTVSTIISWHNRLADCLENMLC